MHSIHNPWGVATLLFLVLFFPCVGIFAAIRNRRALTRVKPLPIRIVRHEVDRGL